MDKITAVVVTYNRKSLLIRCVEYLRRQTIPLDNIIVIDNGCTDGTGSWLDMQTDLDIIHQENVGGSGGFYRGIQHAFENNYDWIWCMDDDVYPEIDCLEKLLQYNDKDTGILTPLRIQDNHVFLSEVIKFNLTNPFKSLHTHNLKEADLNNKDFVYIEGIAFEGPLIKRKVVENIGLPNKDLFLLYDDSDYGYRAKLAGYNIKLITKAILQKELFIDNSSIIEQRRKTKWKLYYHIRNTVYFNRKHGKNFMVQHIRPFFLLMQYLLFLSKNLLFNNKYDLKDISSFFLAYLDGVIGRLGKRG